MTSIRSISPRVVALGAGVALATGALLVPQIVAHQEVRAADNTTAVPTDRTVEAATGIRVLSAHVVGDGGVINLSYRILDGSKAMIVDGDAAHTPLITDQSNGQTLVQTASMRHGETMRTAGTYYLLYFNRGKAVKPGDFVDVTIGGQTLHQVPVT